MFKNTGLYPFYTTFCSSTFLVLVLLYDTQWALVGEAVLVRHLEVTLEGQSQALSHHGLSWGSVEVVAVSVVGEASGVVQDTLYQPR